MEKSIEHRLGLFIHDFESGQEEGEIYLSRQSTCSAYGVTGGPRDQEVMQRARTL